VSRIWGRRKNKKRKRVWKKTKEREEFKYNRLNPTGTGRAAGGEANPQIRTGHSESRERRMYYEFSWSVITS